MGIDRTTYLGPYILCKVTKVPSTMKVFTCSKSDCKKYEYSFYPVDKRKFCETCGSAILGREKPIEIDSVDCHELQMVIKENLMTAYGDYMRSWMRDKNVHIWIANQSVPEVRKFYIDRDQDNVTEINLKMITDESNRFAEFFEKEIVALCDQYGRDNMEYKWGVIHMIS